jgi:hypothetical protein
MAGLVEVRVDPSSACLDKLGVALSLTLQSRLPTFDWPTVDDGTSEREWLQVVEWEDFGVALC